MVARTADDYRAALDYPAPYLLEKLLEEGYVATVEQASGLFMEVKRFLVLCEVTGQQWEMYSTRVDEVWHQFVLYSEEYSCWCTRFIGRHVHHAPKNAPNYPPPDGAGPTFRDFLEQYQVVFGQELPDEWYDERNISADSRVIGKDLGNFDIGFARGEVVIANRRGEEVFAVNALALDAIRAIATQKPFFVRELPGGLTEDEKVGLVSALVKQRLLKVY